MFDIEIAREVGIPFDGGFRYRYVTGGVKIEAVWDEAGQPVFCSRSVFMQIRQYAFEALPAYQEMMGEQIYNAVHDL